MLRVFAFLCVVVACVAGTYVFQGDPYNPTMSRADIATINLWSIEGIKYHSVVHLPKTPDTYAAVFFVGGLGGIVPAESYTGLMKDMAAHGFVVIGVDHLMGGVYPPHANEVLSWLQQHLQSYITKHVPGVKVDWSSLGLMGHSGGAQSILDMVLQNNTIAKASLFLEGGWIKQTSDPRAVNFTHPALIYATEYATRHSLILPECGEPGQAEELYSVWTRPRVLMNVSGFGHCDLLDPFFWEGCHLTDFCYTNRSNNRPLYRSFIQGALSAFLVQFVQGNSLMEPFFTDPSLFHGVTMEDFQSDCCSGSSDRERVVPSVASDERAPALLLRLGTPGKNFFDV
eukprot:gnl/Spiro4/18725_TR10004_c0_g1_i1.p1 gnl/Spiro4/18725_TR10004_c0_g1~~gnl/Spiro4/18725_TR10004_c0_g1_i1.p1  ORF type:complete len:362 (-),score=73.61 gnl/Spiro4/18725_TR10004_c0_g1_i1:70-1095(-)